jgi:hypothetical protein
LNEAKNTYLRAQNQRLCRIAAEFLREENASCFGRISIAKRALVQQPIMGFIEISISIDASILDRSLAPSMPHLMYTRVTRNPPGFSTATAVLFTAGRFEDRQTKRKV